jgi:hypothetical protein
LQVHSGLTLQQQPFWPAAGEMLWGDHVQGAVVGTRVLPCLAYEGAGY